MLTDPRAVVQTFGFASAIKSTRTDGIAGSVDQKTCFKGNAGETECAYNNNNNEYFERLTRTGPKRLHAYEL